MTKLSNLGPPAVEERYCPVVKPENAHFHPCPLCGQAVDWRDPRQVFWHERPDHEPLEVDA